MWRSYYTLYQSPIVAAVILFTPNSVSQPFVQSPVWHFSAEFAWVTRLVAVRGQVGSELVGLGWLVLVLGGLSFSNMSAWAGSHGCNVPRGQDESCTATWDPDSEVTRCHFHCLLLVIASDKSSPGSGNVEINYTSWWEELPRMCGPFKSTSYSVKDELAGIYFEKSSKLLFFFSTFIVFNLAR